MLELVITVADRLVSLLKAGQERDRKLHDDFLIDFASSMEALHRNYLETFTGYRETLQSTSAPLTADHPLIGMVEKDIVFTDQLRAKVRTLSEFENDPVFGSVANAARIYLLGGPTSANVFVNGRRLMNAARGSTIDGLKQIFARTASDKEKLSDGVALLDRIVIELQHSYGSFQKAHLNAKRTLLDRRL